MEIFTLLIHPGFLTLLAISDIRKKEVPVISLLIYFGAAFAGSIVSSDFSVERMVLGIIPAAVLFLINRFTRLDAGGGDIAVFAIVGVTLGYETATGALIIGSLICSVFCIVRIIFRKANRKSRTAFIPFMGIGVALAGLFGQGGL